MSSTIGEPFQLCLSSTFSKRVSSNYQAIYTTYNSNFRGYATVTGQADGIHVWDLQNLHAAASYSVGEHVTFSAPAFSRRVVEDGGRSIVSYAVIRQAPDIVKAHRERTIWVIRQGLSGSRSLAAVKSVAVVPYPPVQISDSVIDALPLLLVSKNGGLCLANAQVEIKSRVDWPGEREHLETFVFPRNSCSFIQGDSASSTSVAVICCKAATSIHVRLLLLGEKIVPVDVCELSIASSTGEGDTSIIGLTCSPEGVLSFIDSRGAWATYQLSCLNSSLLATTVSENLSLRRFAISKQKKPQAGAGLSIVALGSSLVLLAALIDKTHDIMLQLWDLRYGVLLASQGVPTSSLHLPHFSLSVADNGQVLLTLSVSQPHNKNQGSSPRSSVYVVPVDPRLKSTLAAALGKSASTAEWLVTKTSDTREPPQDGEEASLISAMQASLLKKKPQMADEAFFDWVKSNPSTKLIFGHEFVKSIVNVILPPEPPTDYKYSPRIMRYLLENRFVTSIMLKGKLITTLRERGDWESLMLALNNVADVSEDEMMASTKFLIDRQRRNEENAMKADASEGYVPPLWTYLSACVWYPFSPLAMRLAIRKHLSDARDLVSILDMLESWIQGGTEQYMEALLKSMVTNTEIRPSGLDVPPYTKVITFLQALLDASYVALLQYQPCHESLRRILAQIDPEISYIDRMEQLRGALEPFTTARVRFTKEKVDGVSKESPAEWKKRRKRLGQPATLGVGLYRLEELAI